MADETTIMCQMLLDPFVPVKGHTLWYDPGEIGFHSTRKIIGCDWVSRQFVQSGGILRPRIRDKVWNCYRLGDHFADVGPGNASWIRQAIPIGMMPWWACSLIWCESSPWFRDSDPGELNDPWFGGWFLADTSYPFRERTYSMICPVHDDNVPQPGNLAPGLIDPIYGCANFFNRDAQHMKWWNNWYYQRPMWIEGGHTATVKPKETENGFDPYCGNLSISGRTIKTDFDLYKDCNWSPYWNVARYWEECNCIYANINYGECHEPPNELGEKRSITELLVPTNCASLIAAVPWARGHSGWTLGQVAPLPIYLKYGQSYGRAGYWLTDEDLDHNDPWYWWEETYPGSGSYQCVLHDPLCEETGEFLVGYGTTRIMFYATAQDCGFWGVP